MTYRVVVNGALPPDLKRKIAEAHVNAVKKCQQWRKDPPK